MCTAFMIVKSTIIIRVTNYHNSEYTIHEILVACMGMSGLSNTKLLAKYETEITKFNVLE